MRARAFCCGLALVALLPARPGHAGGPKGNDTARVLKLFVDEFIPVTPGKGKFPASFLMGGGGDAPAPERPAHKVTLRRPFAMAKYEVTQELYAALTGKDPSKWRGPRNSVEKVSWDEAGAFCKKATAELRRRGLIGKAEVIRLPSE